MSEYTPVEPVTTDGWHMHTNGSRGKYIMIDNRPAMVDIEWRCAHCGRDITVAGKPDSGGSCPRCRQYLCKRCAGGWCSGSAGKRGG